MVAAFGSTADSPAPNASSVGHALVRHAALETARPQLVAALYGRALRTLRAWLGDPQLAIELTMIGPIEERTVIRTAQGVDISLPFSWLPDVWMRGLAVTFGRPCITAEATDGVHSLIEREANGSTRRECTPTGKAPV